MPSNARDADARPLSPLAALGSTIAFATWGAALSLLFLESANPVLRSGAFLRLAAALLAGLAVLWLAVLVLLAWLPAWRRPPLRGSVADRCLVALPFCVVWGAAAGLLFEPDIRTFLAAAVPGAGSLLLPGWLLVTALLAWLVHRLATRLGRAHRLLPDRAWLVYGGVAALFAGAALSGARAPTAADATSAVASGDADGTWRVVLFGIDGADWRTIDALIERGELPAFARLRAEGATAPLDNLGRGPSPLIWTTAATSRLPDDHGVLGLYEFYAPRFDLRVPRLLFNPLSPVVEATTERKEIYYSDWLAKPLWSVMSEHDRRVLVVNWFFSYPAAPLDGVMISDRPDVWMSLCDGGPEGLEPSRAPTVQPTALQVPGAARVCARAPRTRELLAPFRDWVDARLEAGSAEWGVHVRRTDALEPVLWRESLASEAFVELWRTGDFTLGAFLTRALDGVSHRYSEVVFGRRPSDPRLVTRPDAAERERLWQSVVGAYRDADRTLGQLLEILDERTVLLVMSDHGWEYDGREHLYFPPGVIALHGAPVRAGAALRAPRIHDVAPTLLRLAGIPLSRELEGRALAEAVDPGRLPAALEAVARYGRPGFGGGDPGYEPDRHRAHREQLRALGYIE